MLFYCYVVAIHERPPRVLWCFSELTGMAAPPPGTASDPGHWHWPSAPLPPPGWCWGPHWPRPVEPEKYTQEEDFYTKLKTKQNKFRRDFTTNSTVTKWEGVRKKKKSTVEWEWCVRKSTKCYSSMYCTVNCEEFTVTVNVNSSPMDSTPWHKCQRLASLEWDHHHITRAFHTE